MYYIYRITNKINRKTYIGQRKCPKNKTPETDKYMGSGKRLHLAYGNNGLPERFDRNSEEYQKRYGNRTYNHEKLSAAHMGQTPWNKGKKMSAEYGMKISEANKRLGIKPPSQKGKRWFNNGVVNKMALTCPDGFVPGRIKWAKED